MTSNHTHAAAFNRNYAAPPSQSVNDPAAGSGGFLPARHVLDRYRISQMTLWRWLADDSMGFPKPVYLGRYRYWRIADIEAWEAAQETRGGRLMSIRPSFDNVTDWLAAKPAGHFVIERWGNGFAINIHRVGEPVETILAKSPGEVNQLRQKLSDAGLCGYVSGGA